MQRKFNKKFACSAKKGPGMLVFFRNLCYNKVS